MKGFNKYFCLGAALLVSSSGFADFSDVSKSCNGKTKTSAPQSTMAQKRTMDSSSFDQGLGLPDNKYPAAYNAPAGISVKDAWDFDLFASFIYWYVAQEDMSFAYLPMQRSADPAVAAPASIAFQDFKYTPGFKAGFGFNTNYDGWEFRGEYTWLHETLTKTATPPVLSSGSPGTWLGTSWFSWSGSFNTGASASSKWKLRLDMLDGIFRRPFYQGTQLTVSPYGGLRALWLRQNMNVNFRDEHGVTTSYSHNRSTSWALGPVTGVGGHWLLGEGFRFEGNGGASLLYTRYTKISHSEQTPQVQVAGALGVTTTRSGYAFVRPVGQLAVGLGWGTYCCDDEFYFDLALDYEFLYFWDQNVMREFIVQTVGQAISAGDLAMHGVTATFKFDF
jgi:hypothetical protein